MMKSVLIDASSAILLFKAELFVPLAEIYRVSVVPSVMEEVTVPDRPGTLFFQEMVSKGLMTVEPVDMPLKADPKLSTLDRGERDTMIAFDQIKANFIIIDDRKGALWCRSRNVPYVNALLCTKLLWLSGRLNEENHLCRFEQLLQIGRYSRWVVDFAQCCDKKDLDPFLPNQEGQDACRDLATGRMKAHLLNN